MTAPTLAPYEPPAMADHDSFAHLLRAEWTKFRTVRGWVIAVIVAALVTLLLGVYTGVRSQEGCVNGPCHYTIPTGPGGEAVTDHRRCHRQRDRVPASGADRADDSRAGHPGHHRTEHPADQPLGRHWRARRLGPRRAGARRNAALSAGRVSLCNSWPRVSASPRRGCLLPPATTHDSR
jgi:hypothetical protein